MHWASANSSITAFGWSTRVFQFVQLTREYQRYLIDLKKKLFRVTEREREKKNIAIKRFLFAKWLATGFVQWLASVLPIKPYMVRSAVIFGNGCFTYKRCSARMCHTPTNSNDRQNKSFYFIDVYPCKGTVILLSIEWTRQCWLTD